MQRLHPTLAVSTLLLVLASCTSGPPTVDNALLSELVGSDMLKITEARTVRDSAGDALAAAERATARATDEVELARSETNVTRATLEDAKLASDVARRSGTEAELTSATIAMDYSLSKADESRAFLALKKRELEQCRLAETLAREELRLSKARVELEKAEAVQVLNLPEARQVPVRDYRRQVRYHEVEAAYAAARLTEARTKTAEAKDEHEALRAKTDAMMRGGS